MTATTMGVVPSVFPSYDPGDPDAPSLEFDVTFATAGDATVAVHCLPTQSLCGDRDLRYAVSVGSGPHETVSIDPAGGERDPTWQGAVLRGAAVGTTTHRVKAGERTLRLDALDPGLHVDRVIVYTTGERTTYLGPRETRLAG